MAADWGKIIGAGLGGGIGSFGGPGMAMLGAGIGGGIGGQFGGGNEDEKEYKFAEAPPPKFYEEPRFEEAEGARKGWWEKLQEFGQQPGYGAIAPDWGDIWERAKKRVSQYFWGGPEGGAGLAGKVKASAARRGVSESPALGTELQKMGAVEAGQLGDIATEVGVKEAEFGERGRLNWLQNIAKMAGLRVPGTWQGAQGYMPAQDTSTPFADIAGAGASYLGTMGAQKQQQDWWEKMFKKFPGAAQESIT